MLLHSSAAKRAALAIFFTCASLMVVRSILLIREHTFVLPHWDQWEYFVHRATPQTASFFSYLFEPHGPHIIYASKIISILDEYFFDSTNWMATTANALIVVLLAALLASNTFSGRSDLRSRMMFGAFAVSALSLAQWENLLWAYQFSTVLVFLTCFLDIMCLSSLFQRLGHGATLRAPKSVVFLCIHCLLVASSILSIGYGLAIIVPIIVLLIAYRQRPLTWIVALLPYAVGLALFVWLTGNASDVTDASPRSVLKMAIFYLTTAGAPAAWGAPHAFILGVLFMGALGVFVRGALRHGYPRDVGFVRLIAFSSFLLCVLAIIAWGRSPLGFGFARSSRYCTPTLLLWMCMLALAGAWASRFSTTRVRWDFAAIVAALAIAVISNFTPNAWRGIETANNIRQTAFFVAAGVWSDDQLGTIYPRPSHIRSALERVKTRGLSIFSPFSEFDPSSPLAVSGDAGNQFPDCQLGSADRVHKYVEYGWAIEGWIAESTSKSTPDLVLAFDGHNRLRGLSAPLAKRPDVVAAKGTSSSFRGFLVPVSRLPDDQRTDEKDNSVWLLATFRHGERCRLRGIALN
jgi:hypothetical protein